VVRSYRNEEGQPRQEVLVHLGKHETPQAALAAWPQEIVAHRRAGRDEQAERLQDKLERLRELTRGLDVTPTATPTRSCYAVCVDNLVRREERRKPLIQCIPEVDPTRLELVTSAMRRRRSPN
jgi:hypothetical protein